MHPRSEQEGSRLTAEEGRVCCAGEFAFRIGKADIGAITRDGRELVRRLFVTVRDHNWREISPCEWRVEEGDEGKLRIEARHLSADVDFGWVGEFVISSSDFAFSMEGRVEADTSLCRVGLVLLLPDQALIGASIRAEGPQGREQLTLSSRIFPQTIVDGVPQSMLKAFSGLEIDDAESRLCLSFEGDLFEMEDQRNWSDASFKVYCTPLAAGFPRPLKQGAIVAQTITGRIEPSPAHAGIGAQAPEAAVSVGPSVFPMIGAAWGAVQLGDHDWRRVRLSVQEAATGLPTLKGLQRNACVELAVSTNEIAGVELASVLAAMGDRIGDLLLLDPSSERDVVQARRALAAAGCKPRILATTQGHFVEFNRGKAIPSSVDGLAFPVSPTAHLTDRWTIAENVAVLGDMVRTARQLAARGHVAISPLALFHPPSDGAFPNGMLAPWLAATFSEAARAGVASVTLARDVIDTLHAEPGGVDLVKRMDLWAGRPALPLRVKSHPQLYGIAVRLESGRLDAVVANLSAEPATLDGHGVLSGLPLMPLGGEQAYSPIWRPGIWRLPPASVFVAA
jgi:hypothetical protein